MEQEKKNIGKCPKCGGNVYKTCKGWRCDCGFSLNGIIGNRRMADDEISELLSRRAILLDGFATKEGKMFSTVLVLVEAGEIKMDSRIAKCPRCGGDVHAGTKAFNCSNFSRESDPCKFVIWRNISGHTLTLEEAQEICTKGYMDNEVDMYGEDGSCFNKRLGLTPEKDKVIKI